MRFLVDAQLPPALSRWLVSRGYEAEHVNDREMQSAADAAIWDYALACSAVILTKDEDFAQRRVQTGVGPVIVWIRVPNTRRHDLLTWFEMILPEIVRAIDRGESLVEVT